MTNMTDAIADIAGAIADARIENPEWVPRLEQVEARVRRYFDGTPGITQGDIERAARYIFTRLA